MAEHTPGPWRADESSHKQEFSHWIVGPNDEAIAAVDMFRRTDEHEGNARLIAAAPELLVALRELLMLATMGTLDYAAKYGDTVDPDALWRDAGEKAADAIAKAEGHQPTPTQG